MSFSHPAAHNTLVQYTFTLPCPCAVPLAPYHCPCHTDHVCAQDMERALLDVMKSVTQPFAVGEQSTLNANETSAAMYRMQLGTSQVSLQLSMMNRGVSVTLPGTLAARLSLDSTTVVDAALHASLYAPIFLDASTEIIPVTPIVGVTLAQASPSTRLTVSGLSERINISLPIISSALPSYKGLVWSGQYRCMSFNGSSYRATGCTTLSHTSASDSVKCACNHLSTFIAHVGDPLPLYTCAHTAPICIITCLVCTSAWLLGLIGFPTVSWCTDYMTGLSS
jgi:hypothetical protein